jgi:hypothetical protein
MAPDYVEFHAFSTQTGITTGTRIMTPSVSTIIFQIMKKKKKKKQRTVKASQQFAPFILIWMVQHQAKPRSSSKTKRSERSLRLPSNFSDTTKNLDTSLRRRSSSWLGEGYYVRGLHHVRCQYARHACMGKPRDVHGEQGHPIINRTRVLSPDQENASLSINYHHQHQV